MTMRRKTRLVFFVIALTLLLRVLYSFFATTHPSPPESLPERARPPGHQTRLLIVAHGRSGSTFLGGVFNVHPDVFFVYEPLTRVTRANGAGSSEEFHRKAEIILQSVVSCNFSDGSYLEQRSQFDYFRARSRPLVSPPFCNTSQGGAINFAARPQWNLCVDTISAHALNGVCRRYSHVITKILLERLEPLDLLWALSVTGTRSRPVRIVYLVRDPRAMVFSRYKLGWIAPRLRLQHSLVSGEAEEKVEEICASMKRNVANIGRLPEYLTLVRYEDVATKPEAVVERLFDVLRLRRSENVLKWIGERNQGAFDPNVMSLSRPGKEAVIAWRRTIPLQLVVIVERKCDSVLRTLGYVATNGSEALLRDLGRPLFSPSDARTSRGSSRPRKEKDW